jgi:membrane-associated protein
VDPSQTHTARTSRWVPWDGRATRVDVALIGAIVAVIALGMILRPLKPFLIASHPAMLAFLTGDLVPIGAAAAFARVGELPLWLAVAAGAIGMVKFDWLTWWIGRRWGHGILRMLTSGAQARRWSTWAEHAHPTVIAAAVALAILPGIPTAVVFVLAGWSGMRLVTFLLLDLLGATAVTALVVGAGYSAGQSAVDLILLVDRYASLVSLSIIAIALALPIARQCLRRLERRGQRRSSPESSRASCTDASISASRIDTLSTFTPNGTPVERQ